MPGARPRRGADVSQRGRAPGTAHSLAVFTNTRHRQSGALLRPHSRAAHRRALRAGPRSVTAEAEAAAAMSRCGRGARWVEGREARGGGLRGARVSCQAGRPLPAPLLPAAFSPVKLADPPKSWVVFTCTALISLLPEVNSTLTSDRSRLNSGFHPRPHSSPKSSVFVWMSKAFLRVLRFPVFTT